MSASLLSDLAQQNDDGEWVYFQSDAEEHAIEAAGFLDETLGMSLFDLEIVARVLDLDIRALVAADDGGVSAQVSDWLRDLRGFWNVEGEPGGERRSDAAL